MPDRRNIAVIGLGYVGVPVATAFARRGFNVIGYDITQGWSMVSQLLRDGRGVVLDLKGILDRSDTPAGVDLWRL